MRMNVACLDHVIPFTWCGLRAHYSGKGKQDHPLQRFFSREDHLKTVDPHGRSRAVRKAGRKRFGQSLVHGVLNPRVRFPPPLLTEKLAQRLPVGFLRVAVGQLHATDEQLPALRPGSARPPARGGWNQRGIVGQHEGSVRRKLRLHEGEKHEVECLLPRRFLGSGDPAGLRGTPHARGISAGAKVDARVSVKGFRHAQTRERRLQAPGVCRARAVRQQVREEVFRVLDGVHACLPDGVPLQEAELRIVQRTSEVPIPEAAADLEDVARSAAEETLHPQLG